MNLADGLTAANAYFDADRRRQEWEYQQKLRDATLSTLADKTQAERSGYQLTDAQNQSNMRTQPQREANTLSELALTGKRTAGALGRIDTENKTADINAQVGLGTAQQAQATQPQRQRIENAGLNVAEKTADFNVKELPKKLAMAGRQGAIDRQGQSDVVVGTLGQLLARDDLAGALAFANDVAQEGDVLPNSNGKRFVDIQVGKNAQGQAGYTMIEDNGQGTFIPASSVRGAMDKLKSGKYHFLHTPDGAVYSGNENTGSVTQVQKPNPDLAKAARGQHTPAEVQTMEYLIANKVAKDHTQAWEMVRSAREKTREAFILEFVNKNNMPGQDAIKAADQAGQLYDKIKRDSANQGGPGLGTPAPAAGAVPDYNQYLQ